MNRINGLILTTVLALALCSIAASFFTASLAQEGQLPTSRKPACGCFCGGTTPDFTVFEDKDCAGILAADACAEYLANLPKEKREGYCRHVKARAGFTSFKNSCPVFAPYCEPEEKQLPDTKCEPPRNRKQNPPWLNQDLPCQNRQQATYSWAPNRRDPTVNSVSISICGQVIRYVSRFATTEMTALGLRSFDVCCDTWQNAVSTSSPCDPLRDIDCDGTLNESDSSPFQAPLRRGSSDDFVINSPLTNLPFWKELYRGMPSQSDCKDCKWELVGVQYTCEEKVERTGRRSERIDAEYEYEATWKCPANGQTQVENDSATMKGLRCPSPPNRSWP